MEKDLLIKVANKMVEQADKNMVTNILKAIILNEDDYENAVANYVISKCIGEPALNLVDIDLEKVEKYARERFTNKYYTYIKNTVSISSVNPIRKTVKVSYNYTANDSEDKKVMDGTSEINSNYTDILKDK